MVGMSLTSFHQALTLGMPILWQHISASRGPQKQDWEIVAESLDLVTGRGRLASPCRWLCWWQGKAATLAQRNPLLMHQQSMYNVHTLYTPTGGHGKWPVPAALRIFCIFYVLHKITSHTAPPQGPFFWLKWTLHGSRTP